MRSLVRVQPGALISKSWVTTCDHLPPAVQHKDYHETTTFGGGAAMPRRSVPRYCRHKASGQARVRVNGKDIYLGVYGSPESHRRYADLIADWHSTNDAPVKDLTVGQLTVFYIKWAEGHYRKNGKPTTEVQTIRDALKRLNRLHRGKLAADVSPKTLKTLQQSMIAEDLARNTINASIGRVRRMFRWAVSEELVPPSILLGLQAVRDLQRGRTEARESSPVKPVPDAHIDAVLPLVPDPVRGMILFQLATGARPGEVRILRACDLNMSGKVWEYRPATHKTEHHDRDRIIFIGPRGQDVLREFLTPTLDAYAFCPDGSAGCRPYDRSAYRNAIQRACKRADVPTWTPHQLRHNFGTRARREFGIESTRTALGHSSMQTSMIYAERDNDAARAVVAAIG